MTATNRVSIPAEHRRDVECLWGYHQMGHDLRPVDVGIGLGSHDLGVAKVATDLYHRGMYPLVVFTGANAPTTIDRFPRGEAVHYREYALANGVPDDAILIDTGATNTGENIVNTRRLLAEHGVHPRSVILMSRPYQQRRAYATTKKLWPEVDVSCASHPLPLDDYVASIGDADKVINMLVGDTQRIDRYAELGYAIPQELPRAVTAANARLIDPGFTRRLVT
ncbi:YdcF family protein [Solwaraspora sp. WMMD406]|uniref:YdcF family protein n=1 Tax=Solwaraspora sp. WMMD406 TaxID=3016095 RepID=UPI002416AF74|nr:YdcF family protein [Solwaraspora sp. WMMD406]MDG4764400.1 YdcF family protein [Solwaraspora sp. WMMD406]